VIDVRDMDELQPMQGVADVPASVMAWRQHIRDDADRLIGQNDVSLGVGTQDAQKPTATQVNATAGYAEVRMNLIVQAPAANRWKNSFAGAAHDLEAHLGRQPDLPVQRAMVIGRTSPGIDRRVSGGQPVTAQMLEGTYWFKPHGSVETADLNRQKQDFNGLLQALPAVMQMNPAVAQILSTLPAAKGLVEQMLRVYRWPDRQSFLGSEADGVFDRCNSSRSRRRCNSR
jgi:hypothetical protein